MGIFGLLLSGFIAICFLLGSSADSRSEGGTGFGGCLIAIVVVLAIGFFIAVQTLIALT